MQHKTYNKHNKSDNAFINYHKSKIPKDNHPMMAFRHITNNLPLALKPIVHVSNTYGSTVTIMLLLCKGLCQWISNIADIWYSAYSNIASVDNLPDEMISSENVFGSLVRYGFLSLCYCAIVVTI